MLNPYKERVMRKDDDDLEDVEHYEYSCFDTCERYPEGCKDCDQVMHEGFGPQGKPKPKPQDKPQE